MTKGANTADLCGEANGWIRVNQRKHNLFLKVTAGQLAPVKQRMMSEGQADRYRISVIS